MSWADAEQALLPAAERAAAGEEKAAKGSPPNNSILRLSKSIVGAGGPGFAALAKGLPELRSLGQLLFGVTSQDDEQADAEQFALPVVESAGSREDSAAKGSTLTASIMNLSKNIIGAGMLSLPLAVKEAGVLPFMLGIAVVGTLNAYSFFLLGWCCKATGARTFGDLWTKVFGAETSWIADVSVLLNNGLALLSYCVLCGDFLSKSLPGLLPGVPVLAARGPDLLLAGLLLLLPLSLLKDLALLRFSSVAGLLATFYGFMLLVSDSWAHGGALDAQGPVMLNLAPIRVDGFHALALCSSAFMAHYNAPKFYADLRDNTLPRFAVLVFGAFGLSLFTFACFGLCGFALFGFGVEGNVLKNFSGGNMVLFAWLGMALSAMFTYPLVFSTFRDSSSALLMRLGLAQDTAGACFRVPFTALAVGATVFGGIFFTDVAAVSGVKGAVMSACLAFVFPALMHLKLSDGYAKHMTAARAKLLRAGSVALIIFGVTTGVLALLAQFVFPKTDFSQLASDAAPTPIS